MSYKINLRSFVIGSSIPVSILFLLIISNISVKTYSYKKYSILCPLFFGIANVISNYFASKFNISLRLRLLISSIITSIIIATYVLMNNLYVIDSKYKPLYVLIVFTLHFITWNVIIYNIEKHIK